MKLTELAEADRTEAVSGVTLAQLGGGERMNVQHFTIEPGARVREHAHADHEQITVPAAGEVTFLVEGRTVTACAGDVVVLEPGEAHAVENRGDQTASGIDVYSPPRSDPDWVTS